MPRKGCCFSRMVGKRIRALRKIRKISQDQFALDCGLDRSYMGSIERGQRNITIHTLHKLIDAFGITPKQFFDWDK